MYSFYYNNTSILLKLRVILLKPPTSICAVPWSIVKLPIKQNQSLYIRTLVIKNMRTYFSLLVSKTRWKWKWYRRTMVGQGHMGLNNEMILWGWWIIIIIIACDRIWKLRIVGIWFDAFFKLYQVIGTPICIMLAFFPKRTTLPNQSCIHFL